MVWGFLTPIVEAFSSVGKSFLENRKVKAEGKIEITKAKINWKVKKEELKANMDLTAMQGMEFSWKDEYLTILISVPAVMCFLPDFSIGAFMFSPVTAVREGFSALDTMPSWYQWAFTGVIAAVFGLRTWLGFKK